MTGPLSIFSDTYSTLKDMVVAGSEVSGEELRLISMQFFGCLVGLICYYNFMKYMVFPPSQRKPEILGWILSFGVATILTPTGFLYSSKIFLDPNYSIHYMFTDDAFSQFNVIFFFTYLFLDTTYGIFEYGAAFNLLSGWIHHLFYLLFLTHAYLLGYTVSFNTIAIMEISSIILAGRRLFPNYLRQDMLFGFLFFATRIVFHGYLLYRIGSENVKVNIFPTILAIWALHWYWFSQWCSNKLKRNSFFKLRKP